MSVYKRNRHVSEYEFFHKALEIRVQVNMLMVNEKVVPKRYRLTNGVPTIETARSIVYNINRADSFYPSSPDNVMQRRRYLTLAIADCEQIMLDLQCYIQVRERQAAGSPVEAAGFPGKERIEELVQEVDEEIGLLKGARKNVRLVGKRTADQLISDTEAELESLKAARGLQ